MTDLMKNRRVQIFVIILLISILVLGYKTLTTGNPLEYGMDFVGGTQIQVKLDRAVEASEIDQIISVFQNRLNAFGLRDISVRPFGNEFFVIELAETSPEFVNQIQSLLGQQGKFETLFEGKLVLSGADIAQVLTDPQQGFGVRGGQGSYEWTIPFLLTNDGASSFAQSVAGKCTQIPGSDRCQEQVYMFIDRPENATILIDLAIYESEKEVPSDLVDSENLIPIETLVTNSNAELIVRSILDDETLSELQGKNVIIKTDSFDTAIIEQYAAEVTEIDQITNYWIADALHLENIVHLTPGVTAGTPVSKPSINGYATTLQEAREELKRVEVLLKSGKLPVSVSIGSVSTVSPVLGKEFLMYSGIAGILAIMAVGSLIYVRYRRIKIIVPMVGTSVSEIIMILGVASVIGWQIDLAAVAGIIAAVGTGVDHLIIITDEALVKGVGEIEESVVKKIKKAFSIIFMAGSTTIIAMLPLLFMGAGILKGFALITIIGTLIGVVIARPAYAAIADKILK